MSINKDMSTEQGGEQYKPLKKGSPNAPLSQQGLRLAPEGIGFPQIEDFRAPDEKKSSILETVAGGKGFKVPVPSSRVPEGISITDTPGRDTGFVPDRENLTNSERLRKRREQEKSQKKSRKGWLRATVAAGLIMGSQLLPQVRSFESDLLPEWGGEVLTPNNDVVTREKYFPEVLTTDNFSPEAPSDILKVENPVIDLENKTMRIGFPIDAQTMQNNPTLRFNTTSSPDFSKPAAERVESGIRNVFQLTGLPKGTVVYAPVEGGVYNIQTAGVTVGEGQYAYTPAYATISIRFIDKEGHRGAITVSVLGGKSLIDMPDTPHYKHPFAEDGAQVKMLQPIMVMDSDSYTYGSIGKNSASPMESGQITIQTFYENFDGSAPHPEHMGVNFIKDSQGRIVIPSQN